MRTNLLTETIAALKEHEKAPHDVACVISHATCEDQVGSWADFEELARGVNYNSGYGGAEICGNLVIVGADWWLERGEYDGSEWWAYKEKPMLPARYAPLTLAGLKPPNA